MMPLRSGYSPVAVLMRPPAVWDMRIVWSSESSDPFWVMKACSAGICSMSEGTFGLSRRRWTLSNCSQTTWW